MKTIPLTQGKVAFVDDEDFEWLSKHKWYFHPANAGSSRGYAARNTYQFRKSGTTLLMHVEVMRKMAGERVQADHRNRNGLDNRRQNLRPANDSENSCNRVLHKNNTSGFKGVSFFKRHQKFMARIKARGEMHFLGYFATAEEAASVYREAALRLHGDFASV